MFINDFICKISIRFYLYGSTTLLRKQLTTEQQRKLKELYNKVSDNVKDYCLECLRIDGRLVK